MSAPETRRGFLRGLTTLPLVGGGVALIGAPKAVAEPITDALLDAYSEWLHYERRMLCVERWPGVRDAERIVPCNTGATTFHFPLGVGHVVPNPSARAALVLSAVGCDWRRGGL